MDSPGGGRDLESRRATPSARTGSQRLRTRTSTRSQPRNSVRRRPRLSEPRFDAVGRRRREGTRGRGLERFWEKAERRRGHVQSRRASHPLVYTQNRYRRNRPRKAAIEAGTRRDVAFPLPEVIRRLTLPLSPKTKPEPTTYDTRRPGYHLPQHQTTPARKRWPPASVGEAKRRLRRPHTFEYDARHHPRQDWRSSTTIVDRIREECQGSGLRSSSEGVTTTASTAPTRRAGPYALEAKRSGRFDPSSLSFVLAFSLPPRTSSPPSKHLKAYPRFDTLHTQPQTPANVYAHPEPERT
ncbi:hypothetical protein NMY22_g3664 [Coprinellus aureogranulatus]|nr:hypothetical protein NMY22_g3664 [Coprinellus aureogranulatus]